MDFSPAPTDFKERCGSGDRDARQRLGGPSHLHEHLLGLHRILRMLRRERRRGYTSIVVLALVLAGCSSSRLVTITTDPAGGEVLVDDTVVGNAPLKVEIHGRWAYQGSRARHRIYARSPGFQSGLYRLEATEVYFPGAMTCQFYALWIGCFWATEIGDQVHLRMHAAQEP